MKIIDISQEETVKKKKPKPVKCDCLYGYGFHDFGSCGEGECEQTIWFYKSGRYGTEKEYGECKNKFNFCPLCGKKIRRNNGK